MIVLVALAVVTTYAVDLSRPMHAGANVTVESRACSDWGAAHFAPAAACAAATLQDGSPESRCALATYGQDAPADAPCSHAAARATGAALRAWYAEAAAVCDCIDGGRQNQWCR